MVLSLRSTAGLGVSGSILDSIHAMCGHCLVMIFDHVFEKAICTLYGLPQTMANTFID